MCQTVIVNDEFVDRPARLEELVGGPLVLDEGCKGEVVCLCPVDLKATALKYGFRFRFPAEDEFYADGIFECSTAAPQRSGDKNG